MRRQILFTFYIGEWAKKVWANSKRSLTSVMQSTGRECVFISEIIYDYIDPFYCTGKYGQNNGCYYFIFELLHKKFNLL